MPVEDVDAAALAGILAGERRLVLVEAWMPACEPCRAIRPGLERLADERAALCRVLAIDVRAAPEFASAHGVKSVPTLLFFKRGTLLRRVRAAALSAELEAWLARA